MIKSLTSLRGIFIFFIFFHHCLHLYPGGGTMAVAFFFVLGGFSMTLGYKDKVLMSTFDFKLFLKCRCAKFYPLHWITLLASIPLVIAICNWKHIPHFFVNAALFQTWIPFENVYMSFNLVSWYLADTMFFAVMFPFLIRWITNANMSHRFLLIASLAILYIVVVVTLPNKLHHAVFYVSPYMRLLDFIFGILLALGYMKLKEMRSKWRYGKGAGQFLLLLLIVLLVIESCLLPENVTLYAPVYWSGIGLLIIVSALTEHRWGGQLLLENKYLYRLGELSFIIFMVHQLILRYTTLVFETLLFECNIVYVSLTLVITILLSLFVDQYILKTITQWLTKKIQPSTIARS